MSAVLVAMEVIIHKPEDVHEGNGKVEGDESSVQVVKAGGGSTIQNVIQAVIHMSPWAWVVGVVILAVAALLVAGLFNIGPLRALLPIPLRPSNLPTKMSL